MKFEFDCSELTNFANELKNTSKFDKSMKNTAKEISKVLLKRMKSLTPVDEYDLINGWDGNKFVVTKNGDSYEVLIVNKTPYALYVNDGHMAYNQHGGPYPIKRRIQVRSPQPWQQGDATYYVFGHFFVERGILQLNNTREVENLIMRELEKWWDSV